MKHKRILSILAICLAIIAAFSLLSAAEEGDHSYNWYVKRNKEHKQPQVDPSQAAFEKYDAFYVDKQHSDDVDEKVIYLTFDVGYENGNVAKILDVLKQENVPAAFFILKNVIVKEKPLLDRMINEGHVIGNHTMSHKDMSCFSDACFEEELNGLSTLYKQYTGKEMPLYYRPPEGRYSESNLRCAQKMGYKTIFWSFAYADWDNENQPSREAAKTKITENMHNGAVLLLHPTSATNADILPVLIQEWKAEGYRFGTLDELTGG